VAGRDAIKAARFGIERSVVEDGGGIGAVVFSRGEQIQAAVRSVDHVEVRNFPPELRQPVKEFPLLIDDL